MFINKINNLPLLFGTLPQYFKSLHIGELLVIGDYKLTLNKDGSINDSLSRDSIDLHEDVDKRYRLLRIIFSIDDLDQSFNFVLIDLKNNNIERFNFYPTIYDDTVNDRINLNIAHQLNNNNFIFSSFHDQSNTFIKKYDDLIITNNGGSTHNILFFSILYYLEYRLLNLDDNYMNTYNYIMENINSSTINKYQTRISSFMRGNIGDGRKNEKRGVLLCHGRFHDMNNVNDMIANLGIDPEVNWIFVDSSDSVNADIVGSYKDYALIKHLKHFSYDYVFSMGCPIFDSIESIEWLLRGARWLLRPGGLVVVRKLATFINRNKSYEIPYKMREVQSTENILPNLMIYEYYNSFIIKGRDVIMHID
uniref:Methyltransferase n=1 Tax=Pithovirus LCPAC101 TaxID=2506586 RepID=A0A481Z5T0_9VIRU|nr:MAG: hypothetical protein LCPAC101_02850 [Pithovirus LCPAC101]